ncbi:MAG TPA: LysR substrate-binding domain-containing protein [Eoetvoesiella sp.]
MELRQLRYFVVLAEELNFTRAATRLHISQPPLSLQIAQLERELGVQLFDRTSRRVVLTEAGHTFLHDVRAVQQRLRDASERVLAVDRGLAGRIEVGLSGSHFMGPLPGVIARYASLVPDVAVVLHEMYPADQIEALRERRIDLSISRVVVSDEILRSVPLWKDPVVVALPVAHRFAGRRKLPLEALASEAFVLLRRGTSAYAQRMYDACMQAGFVPREAQSVAEIPAQLNLVAAGLGVALVPASVCVRFEGVVAVCHLARAVGQADVYAILRRDSRKRVIDTFLEAVGGGGPAPVPEVLDKHQLTTKAGDTDL